MATTGEGPSTTQPSGGEGRFMHLLQPIRDLAQNWSIDIAADLEEYLAELEHISVTFDGGGTTLNFAEAALLIQGSACVYSKKVEYLHQLVYEVIDFLHERRRKVQGLPTGSGVGGGAEQGEEGFGGEEPEFLALDDLLEEAGNIDLDEATEGTGVALLPRTPFALLPLDDTDRAHLSGDLARRLEFRVNTSTVHTSGALLLEDSDLSCLLQTACLDEPHTPPRAVEEETTLREAPAYSKATEDDDRDDGGWDGGGDELEEEEEEENEERNTGRKEGRAVTTMMRRGRGPEPDVWEPLDPHIAETAMARPFRKGKTFRIPRDILQPPKSGSSSMPVILCSIPPVHSLRHPFFAEFGPAAARETRRVEKKEKELATAMYPYYQNFEDIEDEEENDFGGGFDAGPDEYDANNEGEDLPALAPVALDEPEEGMPTYEELVRQQIDSFMRGAEEFAMETNMSRRVSEWQDRLEPILAEEASRPTFDIQAYGQRILDGITREREGHAVPFTEVARDAQAFEVARLFLATLQLANNGNVEIHPGPSSDFDLRILSRAHCYENLQTYRAPSGRDDETVDDRPIQRPPKRGGKKVKRVGIADSS